MTVAWTPAPGSTTAAMHHLVRIARTAGACILEHYGAPLDVLQKADASPVTVADHAAHHAILAALARWDPAIPVVSEEGTLPSRAVRLGWRRFWLVDPLDGTKEFLSRNGEFTVNIALIEDGDPVLGVVHAPALNTTYMAARGLGAWRQAGDAPPRAISSEAPRPGAPLRVVESRSHPSAALEEWLAGRPVQARILMGSSLKFCLVAEGRADVYPRLGPTREWDVAAGDCVFRHSGRSGPRHSPLTYNRPELLVPSFVIGLEA